MALGDYTLGGSPIPAGTGKVSTLGFDYTLGGEPFPWMVDGVAEGVTYQFARPSADVYKGDWTNESGL